MLPVCEMLNYAAPCDLSTVSRATDKSTFTKSIYTLAFLCLKPEFFFSLFDPCQILLSGVLLLP